jgi:signal transduction histidine kinase
MRLSVADSLAGRVIESGKPVHANRQAGGSQIKVKTGYLVEAVLYVPLIVGGVTIGVLMAAHHANGKQISSRDEKIVAIIADFAAVAVQNARLYQATTSALTRRVKVLTALNYALSYDLKQKVNAIVGYGGLLQTYGPFETDITDIIQQITHTADTTAQVIEDLLRIAALTEDPLFDQALCDLVEIVGRAISTQEATAAQKNTSLEFQVTGEPYPILGDAAHLCRSVFNLIDNAIKYSPFGAQVSILLNYTDSEISLMVRDTGPGIPEEDLSLLFDQYYRGQGGIGLGLEQVRSTIEAHRGLVQVRNADGGGAEFTIILPGILRVKS